MFVFTPCLPSGSHVCDVPLGYRRYQLQEQLKQREEELNRPILCTDEDSLNYYLLLEKRNIDSCYFDIYPFTNYQIQILNGSLVIKSRADNYSEVLELPEDAGDHFSYKLMDSGYTLIVAIPKTKHLKIANKPSFIECASSQSSPSTNNRTLEDSKNQAKCNIAKKAPISSSPAYDIKVNIFHGNKDKSEENLENVVTDHSGNAADHMIKPESQKEETNGEKTSEAKQIPINSGSTNTINIPVTFGISGNDERDVDMMGQRSDMDKEEESKDEVNTDEKNSSINKEAEQNDSGHKNGGNDSLLKNYETIKRKTIFPPDMMSESDNEEGITEADSDEERTFANSDKKVTCPEPVRRLRTPILENVVDEEFI